MTASQLKCTPLESRGSRPEFQGVDKYLLFDTALYSQIPLPELPACLEAEAVFSVRQVDFQQIDPSEFAPCHEWHSASGQLICRCSRRGSDYLLTLPLQANFHIEAGGIINCAPAPGVAPAVLRQLLLNQVLPRYLAHRGELLLHASAVSLPNGSTVAFLGESGYGKSTLASFCQLRGAQIIDDDCILLSSCKGRLRAVGGVPTVRLYPDSLRALGYDAAGFEPCAISSDKLQMRLSRRGTAGPVLRDLDALFILGPPQQAPADDAVAIAPVAGQAAMMAVLRSVFTLDPSDSNTMSRNFQRAASALADGLPVFQLNFPREHKALPRVLQALLDHRYALSQY